MTEEKESELEKIEVPILQREFAGHLLKYRVKKEICATIAENIGDTGGPTVFEDPIALNERLTAWSQYTGSALRKQILEHWFAIKGVSVGKEAAAKFGLTAAETKREGEKTRKRQKAAEGAVWMVDVDDSSLPKIRMITDESEPGITLTEAKAAAREIGKEREEPIVTYDEETGRHMPNFKSSFVKQNLSAAWATARQMDRALAEGEAIDPMDVWIEQQAKLMQLKEVMGMGTETREKGTVGELVSALKDLQEMAREGKAGEQLGWLSDPAQFLKVMREVSGEGKGDDAVKAELVELRRTLADMQEDRRREEIAGLQTQIRQQADTYQQQFSQVMDKIGEMSHPVTGRTEMDILHEVATEGLGTLKTEAAGMRGLIKEAMMGGMLPPQKSPEQREERKEGYRKALKKDQEIEELGRRLFFGEGGKEEPATQKPRQPVAREPEVMEYPSCYVTALGEEGRQRLCAQFTSDLQGDYNPHDKCNQCNFGGQNPYWANRPLYWTK